VRGICQDADAVVVVCLDSSIMRQEGGQSACRTAMRWYSLMLMMKLVMKIDK
jgi:hypothetical protein